MRILVISDSHKHKDNIFQAIALESPEMILHLGDHERDCIDIEFEYPQIPVRTVRGNCDFSSAGLDVDEFTIDGKRILMTHGHLFGVKTGKTGIINSAISRNVDVLLFGHTHVPFYTTKEKMTVINPGSISSGGKAYAVLEIKNGEVSCELKSLKDV